MEGTRLPPVRQLAADLSLAAGTVARTYRELEKSGLVRTRRGAGTTVAAGQHLLTEEARGERAAEILGHAVRQARALGTTDAEIRQVVAGALAGLPGRASPVP